MKLQRWEKTTDDGAKKLAEVLMQDAEFSSGALGQAIGGSESNQTSNYMA